MTELRQERPRPSAAARLQAAGGAEELEVLKRDFALVVPAFNETPVIPELIEELKETFARHGLAGEVILIDDGSTDGTSESAEKAGEGWGALQVLRHRTNLGKTEALLTAAAATDKSILILFDADLQHSPEEIPRFLEKLSEGWDIVTARKVGAYSKKTVSTIYNRLSNLIFKVPVSDLNSMKAFRREILNEVHLRHDWHRFFVVLALARGYSVTEIDVALFPRRAGESKYSSPLRIVGGLMDLVAIWFLLLFSKKPLLLFGFTGLVLTLLGLVVGAVAFYYRFVVGVGFRPLLYLVVLLVTVGFLLMGFGLVTELIAQTRSEVDALRKRVS